MRAIFRNARMLTTLTIVVLGLLVAAGSVLAQDNNAAKEKFNEGIQAEKDGKLIVPGANFSYSGPLTEAVLLGNAALYYPGEELKWDPKKMTFTNKPQADVHLAGEYREGWKL